MSPESQPQNHPKIEGHNGDVVIIEGRKYRVLSIPYEAFAPTREYTARLFGKPVDHTPTSSSADFQNLPTNREE